MLQSRRGFLIGAGSLLTAAFVKDARSFIRTTVRPLLAPPTQASQTLYWYNDVGDGGYTLSLGELMDPHPPAPTWRAFFISEGIGHQTEDEIERLCYEYSIEDFDGPVPDEYWVDHIEGAGSTFAKAHHLLRDIDFGHSLQTGDAPQLEFHCGGVMGDSSSWVNAMDELSLSLLQARLIDLKMPIKIAEGKGGEVRRAGQIRPCTCPSGGQAGLPNSMLNAAPVKDRARLSRARRAGPTF
jgi:hypothetical protein